MANNIIVIDFFGLPGCGKSVCSHELAKLLQSNGIRVDELTYNMDHHNSMQHRFVLKTIYSLLFLIRYPKQANAINRLIKSCCVTKISYINKQQRNIFYKLYKTFSNNCQLIIMDEGFVQSAISTTVGTEYSSKKLYKDLLDCFPPQKKVICYPIYIETDIMMTLSNMESRQSNDSHAEKIKCIEERRAFMSAFEYKVKCLSEVSKFTILNDGFVTPNQIAERLYDHLYSNIYMSDSSVNY